MPARTRIGRRLLDPELGGDHVGGPEADAADVAREPVRVLRDQLDGVGAVGLEDAHRARGADPVRVQEQHDLADDLLVRPAPDDAPGALGADPVHLAQPLGLLLDDVEHGLAEGRDQPLGVDRADALDHAGAEVLLDALGRGRRGGPQEGGLELQAVRAVVDPGPAGVDELARPIAAAAPTTVDEVALAADLDAQHAEAGLGVVEGDPLDQPGQRLALGSIGRARRRPGCGRASQDGRR